MKKRTRPELVSPAGNLSKLRTAYLYGADAAYVGLKKYSLRERADNFSFEGLSEARRLAEKLHKGLYLAFNIYFYDTDLSELRRMLRKIRNTGLRTLIIADAGLLDILKSEFPDFHIHLSTQANATNSAAVRFYARQGVERVILARELTLKNIASIRKAAPNVELEVFVHGAMCLAYSGRCLLSHYFAGRSANRGDCCQPCRWQYTLTEKERRQGEEFDVVSCERGTTILSSMDMNLSEHVPELCGAGLDAFKIEGRMKSEYYVAVTAKAYSHALEAWARGRPKADPAMFAELDTFSHRPYFTGFYFKPPHQTQKSLASGTRYIRTKSFLGMTGRKSKNGLTKLDIRNTISASEQIEILPPSADARPFRITGLDLYKRVDGKLARTEVLHITDKGYMRPAVSGNIGEGWIMRSATTP